MKSIIFIKNQLFCSVTGWYYYNNISSVFFMKDKTEGEKSFLGNSLEYLVNGAEWLLDKTPKSIKILGIGITAYAAGALTPLHAQETKPVKNDNKTDIEAEFEYPSDEKTEKQPRINKGIGHIIDKYISFSKENSRTEEEISKGIKKLDIDKDGTITKKELIEAFNPFSGKAEKIGEIDFTSYNTKLFDKKEEEQKKEEENIEEKLTPTNLNADIGEKYTASENKLEDKKHLIDKEKDKKYIHNNNILYVEKVNNTNYIYEDDFGKDSKIGVLKDGKIFLFEDFKSLESQIKLKKKLIKDLRFKAGTYKKNKKGTSFSAQFRVQEDTGEESFAVTAEIENSNKDSEDFKEPLEHNSTLFDYRHKIASLYFKIGGDISKDSVKLSSKETIPGDPLTTEITETEDIKDKTDHYWAELETPFFKKHKLKFGYGRKKILETSNIDNLSVSSGTIIDPVEGEIPISIITETLTDSEYNNISRILNLEWTKKNGGENYFSVFGRAVKGTAETDLEVRINNSLTTDQETSEDSFIGLLGVSGKLFSDNFSGKAMLYGVNGDNLSDKENIGAHLNFAYNIENKTNEQKKLLSSFIGGEAGYHCGDSMLGIFYGFLPEDIRNIQSFMESNIEDIMPMDIRSVEGRQLLNKNRYRDLVKNGGGLIYFRTINPENDDPFYVGGLAFGGKGLTTILERRQQSSEDFQNILTLDYSGKKIDPWYIFFETSINKEKGIEDYKYYGLGFGRTFGGK